MRAHFLFVALALLSGPFLGQPVAVQSLQDITTVNCAAGKGFRYALSGISAYNMAWLLNIAWLLNQQDPSANADKLILLTAEGVTRWFSISPDQADTDHGGDGTCKIEVFSLFIPTDGTWMGKVRAQNFTSCAPQVAEMVPGMVAGMAFSRQVAWNGRFDLKALAISSPAPSLPPVALHA